MVSKCEEINYTYSLRKLEETAKTFRNLGEAYEDAKQGEDSFKRQLFLVADVLDDCVTINLKAKEPEKSLVKALERKCFLSGIRIKNVKELTEGNEKIIVLAKTFGKGCISERILRQVVSDVTGVKYYSDTENRVIINEEYKYYTYHKEDRFRILTGVARHNKDKERLNGDNFLISKLGCGKTVAAIADGCGSGRKAFVESRMVIELMENCIEAGFEEKTAIDLINSAYIAGTNYNNPVTMDMGVVDCQAGVINCIKLGAVSTFIKRDNWVEIIKSTTLPIGVLDQIDYDSTVKKLYDGDYVIMISDGVLDNLSGVDKEKKLASIIKNIKVKQPKAMAEEILKKSLQNHNNKAFDDCTVIVLGVFDTFDN